MKKLISVILVAAMLATFCVMFTSCKVDTDNDKNNGNNPNQTNASGEAANDKRFAEYTSVPYEATDEIYDQYVKLIEGKDVSEVKIGMILVGDEEEGYTLAHMNGIEKACEILGLDKDTQLVYKKSIGESEECLDAAKELVAEDCNIIFANSFGHEEYLLQAAELYPDVQFCHATGYQAASSKLPNITNYFNNVYESRYISGIYAGYKLMEIKSENPDAVKDGKMTIGYVGAYPYAEVVSGYTAFYLGVKSVMSNEALYGSDETPVEVEMKVKYTNEWADQGKENDAAKALIAEGCVLISQHADTTGAASACEEAGVYDVGYNVTMTEAAPNYAITSATLNWASFYSYALSNFVAGEKIDTDWCEGYETGAVKITEVNKAAFSNADTYNAAVEAANEAIEEIKAGTLHVFDTSTWTVKGKKITSTKKKAYEDDYHGLQYIKKDKNGVSYFAESTLSSAPSFAFKIDGIVVLTDVD